MVGFLNMYHLLLDWLIKKSISESCVQSGHLSLAHIQKKDVRLIQILKGNGLITDVLFWPLPSDFPQGGNTPHSVRLQSRVSAMSQAK